jgi:hypothetical protein
LHTLSFSGTNIQYVVSDEKSGVEIASILGYAIGKPELPWITFSDEALLQGLLQSGFTEQMAKVYVVEIGIALRSGELFEHYRQNKSMSYGAISFADFSKEFAAVYQHQ